MNGKVAAIGREQSLSVYLSEVSYQIAIYV